MVMGKQCQEIANSGPVFLTVYVTLVSGIVLSSFYVLSAIYSSAGSSTWSLPPLASNSRLQDQAPDSSQLTAVGEVLVPAPSPGNKLMRPIWQAPPSDSKMPPLNTFCLTKELVHQRVKDNIIIVTFGNYAYKDFILTWVKHLTDLGLDNLLVGAMDRKVMKALYWRGIPFFDMGSHINSFDVVWGTPKFHKLGREKIILLDSILAFGYELLMCDTDVVWLKNPIPYLMCFPEADVLTSTDQVVPTVTDDKLDIWQQVDAAYNIGIFFWRATDSTKKFTKEWKDMLIANDKIWDQDAFNELLRRQLGPSVDGGSGLVYAHNGKLKLGLLPASIFCSGHTYFVQATYKQLRLQPYAIHATFQYAATEGKRHRLREAMVFYDPLEYYDSSGGFLTFKPSIPTKLLLDGEHNIETHFSLINYQLKQIRTALAVATLLNRTLVMPPLWCRLDRLWYPHPGVLPGTMTRQPFICPLDHVFEVNAMLNELPVDEFGPGINFREYSFFDNPAMPRHVKQSWLDVQLCQEGSRNCHVSNRTSQFGVLKFPKRSNEKMFQTVFSSFKDVKVIQFSSMENAFVGFSDKARDERFRKRVKRYVGVWCCVEDHKPGHIYYDMYWDEKPGWKPIPPQSHEDDHPPW